MKSIEEQDVFRRLQSSGTSAQVTSKVALDRATSQRQSKTLVSIMQTILGKQRLPMLIIDKPSIVAKGTPLNARAAGIQGLAFLGRDHTYALNEDMSLNREAIKTFYQKYKGEKVLVFGFTFMIWQYLVLNLLEDKLNVRFDDAVVLHGGGWKKLASEAVSNDMFKQGMYNSLGISSVHNFYGMAEQVGSVFLECNQGYLHSPSYADVIVRDHNTHQVQPHKKLGQIQVLSSVPTSYAGHSILTEDLGIIHGHDDCKCGWKGTYFTVTGRMPKVEVRGCSDTHTGVVLE
jgi:hypothetical protein